MLLRRIATTVLIALGTTFGLAACGEEAADVLPTTQDGQSGNDAEASDASDRFSIKVNVAGKDARTYVLSGSLPQSLPITIWDDERSEKRVGWDYSFTLTFAGTSSNDSPELEEFRGRLFPLYEAGSAACAFLNAEYEKLVPAKIFGTDGEEIEAYCTGYGVRFDEKSMERESSSEQATVVFHDKTGVVYLHDNSEESAIELGSPIGWVLTSSTFVLDGSDFGEAAITNSQGHDPILWASPGIKL
jgi:hypothetical protein